MLNPRPLLFNLALRRSAVPLNFPHPPRSSFSYPPLPNPDLTHPRADFFNFMYTLLYRCGVKLVFLFLALRTRVLSFVDIFLTPRSAIEALAVGKATVGTTFLHSEGFI